MKALISLVLVLSIFGCTHVPLIQGEHRATTVKVLAENGYASGVVIAPKRVVTNNHVAQIPGLKINGKPTRVLGVDEANDVAILEAEVDCPCAPIAKEAPKPGDEVEVVGYPMQHVIEGIKTFFKGHVFGDIKDPARTLFSGFAMPGSSGGGIYNKKGELVGITSGVPTWGGTMFGGVQLIHAIVAGVTHSALVAIVKANLV